MNIDPNLIEKSITKRTRAIIPVHFVALHLHPYYANTFGFKRGDFPNAEFVSDRTISLPLSAKLTEEDSDDVVRAVKKIIEKHSV